MYRRQRAITVPLLIAAIVSLFLAGCLSHLGQENTPTAAGINTNNLVEPIGQAASPGILTSSPVRPVSPMSGSRNVLCLSGGGSYGAYSVGVICGWTSRGDRPCFDVVTGISTGALIAPFVFLGSSQDDKLRELYTTIDERDIYRLRPVTGLFSEAFATNRPLARKLNQVVTTEMLAAIAKEHARDRRLYIGTTEMEGRRFIVWDIGAIATRGRPEDLELTKRILLASSSVPGVFPPVRIPVTINQQEFCELHVDGSVSQSVFFLPPVNSIATSSGVKGKQGVNVYVIVAGKLYDDPDLAKPHALSIAIENLKGFGYAHTRADVFRIWSTCSNNGYSFQLTAIPAEFAAPNSMSDFDNNAMIRMYQEGVRQIVSGTAWRTTPPGSGPGEETLIRSSTELIHIPRSQPVSTQR